MIPKNRFISLDVFRGLIICLMIIVNTPGSHDTNFAQLEHAAWNGFTLADLVFPSFLFAVGNALFFSMQKWKNMTQGQVLAKIGRRTLLLFIIGYLLHWFPFFEINAQGHLALKSFAGIRIMGILQRIALCYGLASLMIYYGKPKGAMIVSVLILIAYPFMLLWLGEPGHELEMAGNAVTKLDLWLLGPGHMNHGEAVPFEHEGLLSTLPAITNVIAGYLVGWYIQTAGKTKRMLAWVIATGVVLIMLGLCWNVVFPINKNLWTSSFVLYSVGLDCLLLAAIICITDLLNTTRWIWFFEVFGKNALFIYLLSEVMAILLRATHLYKWIFNHIFIEAGMYTGSLLFAISFMLMCWLTGWILDKRKIYIRV
jgi:predicted acyltransferase